MARNRLLYRPDAVRAMFARLRAELEQMHERHLGEMAELRRELDAVRDQFDQLRSVSLARSRAEFEVAELRRLQAIGRAQAAERDPALPLN
jgi:hypothetical protein